MTIFLLKDISDVKLEQGNAEREKAIQSGRHYSEMLPIEYSTAQSYIYKADTLNHLCKQHSGKPSILTKCKFPEFYHKQLINN